jgi:hypothetical protein
MASVVVWKSECRCEINLLRIDTLSPIYAQWRMERNLLAKREQRECGLSLDEHHTVRAHATAPTRTLVILISGLRPSR